MEVKLSSNNQHDETEGFHYLACACFIREAGVYFELVPPQSWKQLVGQLTTKRTVLSSGQPAAKNSLRLRPNLQYLRWEATRTATHTTTAPSLCERYIPDLSPPYTTFLRRLLPPPSSSPRSSAPSPSTITRRLSRLLASSTAVRPRRKLIKHSSCWVCQHFNINS